MPFKSEAQRRWGNSPAGHKALGDAGVAEWNKATKGKELPEKLAKGGSVMPRFGRPFPARAALGAPVPGRGTIMPPPAGGGGVSPAVPTRGTVVPPPQPNKGFQSAPVAMAAGGPVLGRTRSFMKPDGQADEFTGGRLPAKPSAPVKQDYGTKGAPAKR